MDHGKHRNSQSIRADVQMDLQDSFYIKRMFIILVRGMNEILRSHVKKAFIAAVFVGCVFGWFFRSKLIAERMGFLSDTGVAYLTLFFIMLALLLGVWICGSIMSGACTDRIFFKIGLLNSLQEPPVLIWYRCDGVKKTYCFRANNIPLDTWRSHVSELESALNLMITYQEYYKDTRWVLIEGVSAKVKLPEMLLWEDHYMREEDFRIVIGVSVLGDVVVDLASTAHMLVGGSTGCGKTIFLLSVLIQCLLKRAEVILADFKGGADYVGVIRHEDIISDSACLLDALNNAVSALDKRKKLFADVGCSNLQEYNNICPNDNLSRLIFIFDEAAEVLDKTGLGKEEKSQVDLIAKCLLTIARTGRSAGIHLILATQRPDVNVIPGQLRDNVDCRICGYVSDRNLASMILGGAEDAIETALTEISTRTRGRFVTKDNQLLQSFYLKKGDFVYVQDNGSADACEETE